MMKFAINEKEADAIDEWYENTIKPKALALQKDRGSPLMEGEVYYGAIGGGLTYSFTPTSLGVILTVKEAITDEELNVNDALGWDF